MSRAYVENVAAAGTSFLTIVAPKFCCWTSAMAALSNGASYLAWVHPMRPYLFAISFVLVGYSFYKAYHPTNSKTKRTDDQCQACQKKETHFLHTKGFTWMVALSVVLMFLINYL
ncbi:MAG: hypothetical protein RJQ09_06570 [Cyclobacteriaceae bacterium]